MDKGSGHVTMGTAGEGFISMSWSSASSWKEDAKVEEEMEREEVAVADAMADEEDEADAVTEEVEEIVI